ncbi:unnamed protein product [Sphenostylis stenocarpa]|uniref:BZIP domain-containing protein n=1 Tax=Sphenostylis stenocarpa TaxID=92480 RepID=A0AA86S4X3_9FABA|nr:unnamed protein product [Sphenostylis stenocarpa]
MRPPTLNIFPSKPMHVEPSSSKSKVNVELVSPQTSGSKRPSEPSMELANPRNEAASAPQPPKAVKRETNRKGPTSSSEQEGPKTPDPKTLRRLAQNREAARKSRLRKKVSDSPGRLFELNPDILHSFGKIFKGPLIGHVPLDFSSFTLSGICSTTRVK